MKLMKLTSISLALSGIFAANATANEQKTEKSW